MPTPPRNPGRLFLFLFAWVTGCGPAVVFPSRAPDQFYVFGQAELDADFEPQAPARRRYRFRAFNHFLHPFEQLTWTLGAKSTPAEANFEITLQDGLSPINGEVPPYILRHRFGEAFEIDVVGSGDRVHLEVEAVFTQSADVDSPPLWATHPLELLVEEIDPTDLPFGAWRFAQDGGPRPVFPPREVRCGEHARPQPILLGEGPALTLPRAEVNGAWLDLRGVELDDVEVQFGDVPSPRVVALRRDYVQAEIPLLPAGAVSVRVRSGEARTVIDNLFEVRDAELTAFPGPPAGAAVDAVDDGAQRLVATDDSVFEVVGHGYRPRPPAAIPLSGIRALSLRPPALWAATYEGLFVSENNAPWERRLEGRFSALGEISAAVMAVGGDPTLAISWDDGAKFTRWPADLELRDVFFDDSAHRNALGVSADGSLWISPDGGRDPWRQLPPTEVRDIVEAPAECEALLAASPSGTWRSVAPPDQWRQSGPRLERLATAGRRLFGAGPDGVWEWVPHTWRKLASLPDRAEVRALSVHPEGTRLEVYTESARFELGPRLEAASR